MQVDESPLDAAEVAERGLSYFTRLTALQRSCVILKDVLWSSLEEIRRFSIPACRPSRARCIAGARA